MRPHNHPNQHNLVVKSGNLRSHEAQTLRFIKANTTIPVPKVDDIHWQDDQIVSFVKDYMPGRRMAYFGFHPETFHC
jgi:hypothetical protein